MASSAGLVSIPRVSLRKVIALASVDSAATAGFSAVCFPSSVLRLWFSTLAFFLRLRSLAGYRGVGVGFGEPHLRVML